jgi:hypothetical protein
MTPIEKYLKHLDDIFRIEPTFYKNDSKIKGINGATSIIYENVPEDGTITGLSYGLSTVPHPDWKFGRPELSISVDSKESAWGDIPGYLANDMRGEFAFGYGQIIDFETQIADDSEMTAFFVFSPSFLEKEDYSDIDVGLDYKITIAGLYPIYKEEIAVFKRLGLEKFWHHPNFDLYSVNRPRVK